jgi:hypothetical protein
MGTPCTKQTTTLRRGEDDAARASGSDYVRLGGRVGVLAALEDALEVVAQSDYLGVVAEVETEVSRLHRKLRFDHPSGGENGR